VILAIGWTITALLTVIIIGLLLIPVRIVLSEVPFVHMAYAAHKANQGVDYRYPFVADLIGGSRRRGTLLAEEGRDPRWSSLTQSELTAEDDDRVTVGA
jgi:hypothetical protein